MPFLHDLHPSGTPSFSPLPTTIANNFIFANYGSSQGVDNDDGSSHFDTHDNVFYMADGFKMDYGGTWQIVHDILFHGCQSGFVVPPSRTLLLVDSQVMNDVLLHHSATRLLPVPCIPRVRIALCGL